jgi:MFS family permease
MGAPTAEDKTAGSPWVTLGVLSCLGLVTLFGETMLLPAIPDIITQFGISYSTSSWILSAYLIAAAVVTPVAGKLSDIYGKKRMLLLILGVYIAGVLVGGFADNIGTMIVARLAQGAGVAMFPIAFGIIREALPENRLAVGQTIFGSTFFAGAIVGLVVGAGIVERLGWHFTYFSIFPIATLLAVAISKVVKDGGPGAPDPASVAEGHARPAPLDVKGTLSLAATIVFFLGGVSLLQSGASDTAAALGLVAASVASLFVLVYLERRADSPLLDLGLLVKRPFLPATIILMLVGFCTLMVYQTIPIMVRSPPPLGFGGDAVETANVQLPFMAALLVGTIGSGFILNWMGNTRMAAAGTIASTLGFLSLLVVHSTEGMVAVDLGVIASGLSFSFTGGFNIILVTAPLETTGIILGMALLLNLVGEAVGPAVAASFQQANQGSVPGTPGTFPLPAAYDLIFLTATLVSVASVVLALALWLRRDRSHVAPPAAE